MTNARISQSAALVLALAACAEETPGLSPPGLDGTAPRLYFPIGVAASPDGRTLYVANSNFDRAYNGGTLVALPTSAFDDASAAESKRVDLPASAVAARLDAFAGPLGVNPSGSALYVATRDADALTRISLDAGGAFACPSEGCSSGAVELRGQGLEDPFALAFGDVIFPGATSPEPAVFVSHLTPPSSGQGASAANARVAVIPERLAAGQSAEPFSNGAFAVDIGAPASTSLAWSQAGGRLFVGGCNIRVSADQVVPCASDPSSSFVKSNPLRQFRPESGASAPVSQSGLGLAIGGGDTVDLALSSDGLLAYVATNRPSALVIIEMPNVEGTAPVVRSIVPLTSAPARMRLLSRATGDIVAVTSTTNNALMLVDPVAATVLTELRGVGAGPYEIASAPTAGGDRLYVGLFRGCGVAAIDVPSLRPDEASLVGTVGGCP